MKTTLSVVAVALASSSLFACSSAAEPGSSIDTQSALSALSTPTGTLTKESAGKAFGGYRHQRDEGSKVATPTTSAGGLSTSSIRLLDSSSGGSCREGSSCACPSGGSMTYKGEQRSDAQLVKVRLDGCGFEDGVSFDGDVVLLASKKSLLGFAGSSGASAATPPPASKTGGATGGGADLGGEGSGSGSESGGLSDAPSTSFGNGVVALLVAAKGTLSYGAQRTALELALVTEARYTFLSVKVPDGSIVIGTSSDGRAVVRTKNGSWTCSSTAGRWVCTSDSGEKLDVTEEAPSDGEGGELSGPASPSPSPSGSGSSGPAPVPPPSGGASGSDS